MVSHALKVVQTLIVALLPLVAFGQLSGNYTIDAKSSGTRNFTSISNAVLALENSGVSAGVNFRIAKGSYIERIEISPISGASSSSIITFDGVNSDSVTITFAANASTKRATWHLKGADFIHLKNVTLKSTGTFRSNLHFSDQADYNLVSNCVLEIQGSNSDYRNVVFASDQWAAGNHGNHNTISDSRIIGGYYGVFNYGSASLSGFNNSNNLFLNLDIEDAYFYGIYNYYGCNGFYKNVKIEPSYAYGYSFYNYYGIGNRIDSCHFKGSGYGFFDDYGKTNSVVNCLIEDQNEHNIYSNYSENTQFEGNRLLNPNNYNLYSYSTKGMVLVNNWLEGGNTYTYYNWASYNGEKDSVVNNYFTRANHYNLLISGNKNSIFLNNIIFGELPGKESFESNFYLYNSDSTKLYHNTFYNNGGGGSFLGAYAYAVPSNLFNFNSLNTDVRNNLFEYSGSFKAAANIANYNGTFSNLDFNNYSCSKLVFIENAKTYSSLNVWFAAQGLYNANSYSQTNYFQDTTKGDLHLDKNYPRLQGKPIFGVSSDFDGQARCVYGPTLGADENTNPVAALNADFIAPDTVYLGNSTVFLNKNANTIGASHSWWVNGVWDTTSSNFEYTFKNAGKHYVKLLSINCGGLDTITKSVFADTAQYKPMADFVLSKYEVEVSEEVALTDLSINGPTSWEWSITPDSIYDTLQSVMVSIINYAKGTDKYSRKPKFQINYAGIYTIELKAANRIGSTKAIKKDVLTVKGENQMCQSSNYSQMPSGRLFDQGGASGDYANNTNCSFLIDPCAKEVELTFKEFELDAGSDFVRIYDGMDNKGKPLWNIAQYGGNGISGNISDSWFDSTFTAISGKMYIEMSTDAFDVLSGFEAEWTSIPSNYLPTQAKFISPDTVCVNDVVYFENESKGEIIACLWDFGVNNSSVSSLKNPSFSYTKAGTWKVTMIAKGCGGIDTMERTIVSRLTNVRPISNFVVDITKPAKTDVVQLIPNTENCVSKHYWYISPNRGFAFVNNTNDSSIAPQIIFSNTGSYSVTLIVESSVGSDTLTRFNYIQVINYCTPTSSSYLEDLGISKVELNGNPVLKKESAAGESSYSNFISEATSLEIGYTYTLEISRPSSNNRIKRAAWIDWNQNGIFDSLELIGEEQKGGTNNLTCAFKFTAPINSLTGGTRMRVASNLGKETNTPCGKHLFGEFEDFRINVLSDETAPKITLFGNDTVYVNECHRYKEQGATVCDNIDGCRLSFITSGTVDTNKPGEYKIYYSAKDSSNNSAETATRVVVVLKDEISPSIELIGADTILVDVFSSYNELGVVAEDSCGLPSVNIIGYLDTSVLGNYHKDYFASDGKNGSSIKRFINVVDREAPEIKLYGRDTVIIDVFETYYDQGADYTDNYYKQSDLLIQESNNVNTAKIGKYTVSYSVVDPSGNSANKVERTVIVKDRTAPEIFLQGPDTVVLEVGAKFQDLLARAIDNLDGELGLPTIGGNFYQKFPTARATDIGVYKAQYIFSDFYGNSDSVARTIIVLDTEEPFIRLKGGAIVRLCRWEEFVEPGFEVTDNYDKFPTVIKDESNFSSSSIGEYFVTYYAEDQSGNKSEIVTRRISVVDCATLIHPQLQAKDVFSVFPNPNKGAFSISIKSEMVNVNSVILYNLHGKLVAAKEGDGLASELTFDVKHCPKGVYLLKVKTSHSLYTTKLVFE